MHRLTDIPEDHAVSVTTTTQTADISHKPQGDFDPFKMQANVGEAAPWEMASTKASAPQSDIDRRMELLEARFVSPAPLGGNRDVGSAPHSPAGGVSFKDDQLTSPSKTTPTSTDLQQMLLQAHSSGSHHSFSFAEQQQDTEGVGGAGSSRQSSHSQSSAASRHSQPQRPPLIQTQSYREANAAVERHMARVGAALNIAPPPYATTIGGAAGSSPAGAGGGGGDALSRSSSCSASSLGSKSAAAAHATTRTGGANSFVGDSIPSSTICINEKSKNPANHPGAQFSDGSFGTQNRNQQNTSSRLPVPENLSPDTSASNAHAGLGAPVLSAGTHKDKGLRNHRPSHQTCTNADTSRTSPSASTLSTTATGTTKSESVTTPPTGCAAASTAGARVRPGTAAASAMPSQHSNPPPLPLGGDAHPSASHSSRLSTRSASQACSSSNQTLLTGHLHRINKTKAATVVAESPPIGDEMDGEEDAANAGAVKSLRLPTNRDAAPTSGNGGGMGGRKKSVPHKRPPSAINIEGAPGHRNKSSGGGAAGAAAGAGANDGTPNGRGRSPQGGAEKRDRSKSPAASAERRPSRKRTRLQFDGATAQPQQQQQKTEAQPSSPRPASATSLGETASAPAQPTESADPVSRDRSGSGAGASSSNPATPKSSSKRSQNPPPSNNKPITAFFVSSAKKKRASASTSQPQTPARISQAGVAADGPATAANTPLRPVSPGANAASGATGSATAVQASGETERALRRRVADLERLLADRDEQLRAVSNNQTMMQHSLRSSLVQRERELEELRRETDDRSARCRAKIEELVRSESGREARDVRQRLASDGARLGKFVHVRTGLRTVPAWEDGDAARALKRRRGELRRRREELERRQKAATEAAERVRGGEENARVVAADSGETSEETVGGFASVIDSLDAMEAVESVRFHLANLRKEEEKLAEEEKALHAETAAHQRELSRVGNEDSSRFKSRPTMHDRYVPISQLGKGGFSEVWRAFDLVELREVAVKIHQLDPRWSESKRDNYTKHVSREYDIHRSVRHPRVVSLYDVFEIDTHSFATVLECCEGSPNDLDALLKEKKFLTERDARAILIQILSGMRYLSAPSEDGQRQGVIHYDLKPGNILFDKYGDAKITDFGLSKIVDTADPADSMELTSQGAGTYWYLPPECFMTHQNVRISNKVDVWSIGVIYFQMLYGQRPFGHGQSQERVLSNNVMLNAREVVFPSKPAGVSEGAKDFIRKCLTHDQAFRPNVSQLCEHSYLQQNIL